MLKFSASSRSNKESILSSPENKSHKRVRPAKTKDIRPFNPASEESKCLNVVMSENRLDKAMIKYNEAMSIKKTYELIVKRLKDERVGYDNQLAAIE